MTTPWWVFIVVPAISVSSVYLLAFVFGLGFTYGQMVCEDYFSRLKWKRYEKRQAKMLKESNKEPAPAPLKYGALYKRGRLKP